MVYPPASRSATGLRRQCRLRRRRGNCLSERPDGPHRLPSVIGERLASLGIRSTAGVDANRGFRDFGVSFSAASTTAARSRTGLSPSGGLLARQTVSEAVLDIASTGTVGQIVVDLQRSQLSQASVVVNDIDTVNADLVVSEIRDAGGVAIASHDSVADPQAAANLVESAIREFGRLDALINNAAWRPNPFAQAGVVAPPRSAAFEDLSIEDLDGYLSVHLRGAFFVAQHAYRQMKKQHYGRIVNVSSSAGAYGIWGLSGYGAAKMAQIGMMNVISMEGAEHGILVNAVLPGARSTWRSPNARPEEMAASAKKLGPLANRNTAEFVVPLTIYLASEACNRTHYMYNASMGWYSRVFIGVAPGWMSPGDQPATAGELVAHLDEIKDRSGYSVPMHRTDYSDFMLEQSRRLETKR